MRALYVQEKRQKRAEKTQTDLYLYVQEPYSKGMNDATMLVAETIREQLGGRTLYMLGAKDLVGDANGLQFAIRGSRKVSKIRIELTPADTYTVRFYRGRGLNLKEIASVEDVYVDSLHQTIEKYTGLITSL